MSTFVIYKPFGMLSQFTKEAEHHVTLEDLDFTFPSDVYPIGRLDADSEGLLLLSNNKGLNKKLLDPKSETAKTYLVQVEGVPNENDLIPILKGMKLRIKKKDHHTKPAQVKIISPPNLPERNPPIRVRKSVPDSWLEITISEGKNRQVRKMCAAIGYPVLRLVRSDFAQFSIFKEPLLDMNPWDVVVV